MTGTLLDASATNGASTGIIENLRHPAVRRITDVLRSQTARPRTILIDDEENIAQALRAGLRLLALYATAGYAEAARRLQQGIPSISLHVLGDEVARSVFGREKAARLFALAQAPAPTSWRDLSTRRGDVLVLDGVRIAGNIGAILRSARAFDTAGIVLIDSGLTTVYDRRLIRASRGLVFTIPALITTRTELARFLRAERIPLASLSADAGTSLETISRLRGRIAVLLGSERAGASGELTSIATHRYAVPMSPDVESLNVSVAAGIALYERQRSR
ncbi:TrmH family RNA methyltransferase [Leucobacter tenebrionis]|uniref:TrmH family RNA methyltransferase n=1 Tax=Leucobacter tenebrionis TaxID=2873270 RepID=UPI001CA6CFDA|nr:TrmH family RNA methyltransferase [Leucobacter tenebrionis]QZY51527.1 NshR/TsnR family 23S rRNA methyltransferase [Leucobacter tenebrionis]